MKSCFLTDLDIVLRDDCIWILASPLIYRCALLSMDIVIPEGFNTDLASVPRVPIIYEAWGSRAHREAVLHDYLYRKNSNPAVSREVANSIFLEAMASRGVSWWIRYPMYWGVSFGGCFLYHARNVLDKLWKIG
jgi:hypothetical protein